MRRRLRNRLLLVALAASLALAFTACGGDSEAETEAVTTDDAPATTAGEAQTTTSPDQPSTTAAPEAADATADMAAICTTLTVEDVNGITGLDVAEGEINDLISSDSQAVCEWTHQGDGVAFVQVLVIPGGGSGVNGQRESLASVFEVEVADASVSGANGAYVWSGLVGMAVGDDFIQVSYVPAVDEPDLDAKATELATIVAGNWAG